MPTRFAPKTEIRDGDARRTRKNARWRVSIGPNPDSQQHRRTHSGSILQSWLRVLTRVLTLGANG